jgi:hypothetical protein
MLSTTKIGTSCVQQKKDHTTPGRVLHGCGLCFDQRLGLFTWYSNLTSSAYCDGSYTWHSGHIDWAFPTGICPNGMWTWDIHVTD